MFKLQIGFHQLMHAQYREFTDENNIPKMDFLIMQFYNAKV